VTESVLLLGVDVPDDAALGCSLVDGVLVGAGELLVVSGDELIGVAGAGVLGVVSIDEGAGVDSEDAVRLVVVER
jgi:hypothetical protein